MREIPITELELKATEDNYEHFISFIESRLTKAQIDARDKTTILTACEELIVNILHFAYCGPEGTLVIAIEVTRRIVSITFVDRGVAFNPFEKPDIDVSQSIDERPPGGLGIFLVKKLMDDVEYAYRDKKNIVRITKRLPDRSPAMHQT